MLCLLATFFILINHLKIEIGENKEQQEQNTLVMTACFSGGATKQSKEWSYTYTATAGAYPILLLSVSHHMRPP